MGKKAKSVLTNALFIMTTLNIILITISILLSKYISYNLINNKDTYLPLLACISTLPIISLGYIIKGYYYGKQNVIPNTIGNIIEQIIKLILILTILPLFSKYNKSIQITMFILFNLITESTSTYILYLFLPKKINIKDIKTNYDKEETKTLLNLSIPSTLSRLIGNIGFFFEPIIYTKTCTLTKYTTKYITDSYGIYNGYCIPTLLVPSFFISAISQSLMPEITKLYKQNNIRSLKKRIIESITLSLIIGITFTSIIYIFKDNILTLLFNNISASPYINLLAPFFILFYLEGPISSILIALNKIKLTTYITTSGIFIKLVTLSILGILGLGIYAIIISEIINIIYVTLISIISLIRLINNI